MHHSKLIICIVSIIPTLSLAALPPAAESLRRIKTIAESPLVFEKIGSAALVTGIHETDGGYIVTTNQCELKVSIKTTNLNDIEPGMIGPPKLEVVVGEMRCEKQH